jgi:hypothetical protein
MKNKKVIFRILIAAISVFFLVVLFLNSNYFISKQEWKYRDGGSVGDWIEFDNTYYSLKGKTIYKKNTPAGKVVFCLGKMLIIKEISTGEKGFYINKTNF